MSAPEQTAADAHGLAQRAARFVIERGLISATDVHRHGICARDLSQSNGVALVEAGNGRGFAAKDMRRTKRSKGQGSPDRELALYRAMAGCEELKGFAPAFHEYDDDRKVMILEGLITFRRLDQLGGGRLVLDPEAAGWLGRSLGHWRARAASICELRPTKPWLLEIDGVNRLSVLDTETALCELVDKILACDTLRSALGTVRSRWRVRTVIHGDVRFANVMVLRSPPTVRLIDWETSGLGDPTWDVAGAIQEYLSVGLAGGNALERSPAEAPVVALLEAYEGASQFAMTWSRLGPFVACRVLMRAIQLANWGDAGDQISKHLDLARALAHGPPNPFGS